MLTDRRTLCKKVNQIVSAIARIARISPFQKRRLMLKTFIGSQFSYCPLIWMFCSGKMNDKINHIHERALLNFLHLYYGFIYAHFECWQEVKPMKNKLLLLLDK